MATGEPTIPALLSLRRREDPEAQAVVCDGDAITYAALEDASGALSARLAAAGVGKGSRVGLLLPNGVDWAVAALAVTRIGAVLVPLSTLLKAPELLAHLRVAAVSHLLLAEEFRGRAYREELRGLAPATVDAVCGGRRDAVLPFLRRIWSWDELPAEHVPAALVAAVEAAVRPSDDLVILFTSGSRGTPKGVVHTHGNALRATAATLESRRIGRGERLYIPMPLFWTGGFSGGLLTAFVAGATLLTEAVPEAARTIRFLEKERATLFRGWPDQAERLAAHPDFATADLSSLRPASLPAVLPAARRPAPGARPNLFGMTETFGPYCGAALDEELPVGKHGSCGRPFPGIDVRIVAAGIGAEVPPGVEGEIRLRGRTVMRGICGRPRTETFDADGFYRTGDLGVLDADGYLWYRGRLDDMIKIKGATVYPLEVEAALRGVPGIRDAFVTDVLDVAGERQVAALVVLAPDATADRLLAAARSRLSSFKVPTRWLVVDGPADVPRLATGKVDIAALRRLLHDKGSADLIREGASS